MKKYNITCILGHRLLDIEEGSNMIVRIKCSNQKTCPHKAVCKRKTEIIFGEPPDMIANLEHYVCPTCDKRLFDVVVGSQGVVQIKCGHCGKMIRIPIGMHSLSGYAVY